MAAQRAAKLERMAALLAALDHPERAFQAVLVAGTKGKGSTVAMIAACLQAAGRRTARYTSPHLINWRERTCIDARPIPTSDVVSLAEPLRQAIARLPSGLGTLTTFEAGTALAFAYFARERVDIAVLEVGTGGRFDATNLVEPLVSVVTPISYDHTPTLGETLTEIAWHKAGILRPRQPAVSAPQVEEARRVVEREADSIGAPLEVVGRDWCWSATPNGIRIDSSCPELAPLETDVALLGNHQYDNATAAVAALHALGRVEPKLEVAPGAIRAGLAGVDWPGRFQVLAQHPLLVLDGAHNAASAEVLASTIDSVLRYARLHLVLGLSAGKDARGVLDALAPRAACVYLTRSHHERSAAPSELAPVVRAAAPAAELRIAEDVPGALAAALVGASADDLVLVTGSLFVVGETLVWWRRSRR